MDIVKAYARFRRWLARIASLTAGYLLVWAATAAGALGLASAIDWAAGHHAATLPWIGGAVLVGAGLYQLSPLKHRCLARCRSPLSFALAASRHSGRARDLKVGLEHGAWCVGCCWALMAALVAVGTMFLAWMAAIVHAVHRAAISIEHTADRRSIAAGGWVTVRERAPVETTEIVSCGIPGHDHPGTEIVAETLTVDDGPLRFEVSRCGFASVFTYSSTP